MFQSPELLVWQGDNHVHLQRVFVMNINKWHCNRPLQPRGFHPSWENITAGLTHATDPGMARSGKPDRSSRN